MYLTEITYGGSNVLVMCVVGVWRRILDLWCVCVCVYVCVCVCVRARCVGVRRNAHTRHRFRVRRQTPTTHITSTFDPPYVISVKYRLSLPDDGSHVIRNMLE
jgi:hypothetical protein